MASDEVKLAQEAQAGGDTIFGKILRKEIPCVSLREISDELNNNLRILTDFHLRG